jgi:hypothetical protein
VAEVHLSNESLNASEIATKQNAEESP